MKNGIKIKTTFIFVILVYRNSDDLLSFIMKLHTTDIYDYKVVIVNSFFDVDTMNKVKEIANLNKCDFINVPNKGYGAGNNAGISYAIQHYKFDFIIISNPDVVINKFDIKNLLAHKDEKIAIGPIIHTLNGKNQNPYWLIKNYLTEKLIYIGYKEKNRIPLYLGLGINKVIRQIGLAYFKLISKKYIKVFALHGCFIIFSASAIFTLYPLFDEKMFLFAEESYLAHKMLHRGVTSFVTKTINIIHQEDGSISIANINESDESRKSVIYYFENLYGKKSY
jgi:GT2 family glycosyltransferase